MPRGDETRARGISADEAISPLARRPLDADTRYAIAALTGAPSLIVPWLDRFYSPDDAALVLATRDAQEALAGVSQQTLGRAVRRAVLDETSDGALTPASFHARFEMWAFFEGWGDVPEDVRELLNEWELASYVEEARAGIEAVRAGRPDEGDQSDYTFLLLEEAEELLRAQPHVYLWPCNCRAMWRRCDKSLNVCLRFGNAREVGWELTHERAIELLHEADAEGLMHTAYRGSQHGDHGLCNCCNDCCFPLLASERIGAEASWPVRRHLARIDAASCDSCERCVERCPFGALSRPDARGPVVVDAAACRGCGLCATGCPNDAITMAPLPAPAPAI